MNYEQMKIKTAEKIAQSARVLQLNVAFSWIHNYYIALWCKMWKYSEVTSSWIIKAIIWCCCLTARNTATVDGCWWHSVSTGGGRRVAPPCIRCLSINWVALALRLMEQTKSRGWGGSGGAQRRQWVKVAAAHTQKHPPGLRACFHIEMLTVSDPTKHHPPLHWAQPLNANVTQHRPRIC